VIVGGSGSFFGTDTADRVTNRSTMTGDVLLGDGDDVLDGRGGLFNGQFFGGNGNDRMDLRGAGPVPDTIFGDSGVDTILGTDGGDTIQGEGSDVPFGKVGIDLLLGAMAMTHWTAAQAGTRCWVAAATTPLPVGLAATC